jgi:hypothetical protein
MLDVTSWKEINKLFLFLFLFLFYYSIFSKWREKIVDESLEVSSKEDPSNGVSYIQLRNLLGS